MKSRILVVLGASVLAIASVTSGQTIIHVDDDAPPNGDGTTWENAYRFLQDALSDASSAMPPVEIRVAQGIYRPDESTAAPSGTGDIFVSFALLDGVSLRGGYAGVGRARPDQRDPLAFRTVLSGDLDDNDEGDFERIDDNAAHVVTAIEVDATAELDGFIIMHGNADIEGLRGGGLWIFGGSPTVRDCTFTANYGRVGGAVSGEGGRPTFVRCDLSGNAARLTGGGLDFQGDARPEMYNCRIASNRAFRSAGIALGNLNSPGSPFIVNSLISNNVATDGSGGGLVASNSSKATLINCTIVENTAQVGFNGGIRTQHSAFVKLRNCIVWGNRDPSGTTESAQIKRDVGGTVEIDFTAVQSWTGIFEGEGNVGGSGIPAFIDPDGPDNLPGTWQDNNYRLGVGSIAVDAGRNASVPPDLVDLDGDGDDREPTPVDRDDAARFVDDESVRDVGDGRPPLVDMGAYERDPAAYRSQFRERARYWLGGDGAFEDAARWLDGTPQPTEQAVFSAGGSSLITTSAPVIVDAISVTDGELELLIDSSLTCTDVLRIGTASPRLTVTGGTLSASEVIVEGNNAAFRSASRIAGDVRNFGSFGSAADPGEIFIDGDYRQVERTNGQERAGDLLIRVGGDAECGTVDTLVVSGTAALGGGLVLEVSDRCVGGDDLARVTILSAANVDPEANRFDGVANLPVFPDGSFGRIVYEEIPAVGPGPPAFSVVLEITTQSELLSRLNPLEPSTDSGDPTAATMADLDGDGDDDVAVCILGPRGTPGEVLILLGDGTGGFEAVEPVTVGVEPRGITAGPLDGNDSIDLAVTNAASDSVTILTNDGAGGFIESETVAVGLPDDDLGSIDNRPLGIIAFRTLPESTLVSFSLIGVVNSGSNTVSVLFDQGGRGFAQTQLHETGACPRSIAWLDIDEDKDLDMIVANYCSNSISFFVNNGSGQFQTFAAVTVGDGPMQIETGDVNADGRGDLLIGNAGNGTISVLIGEGAGAFRPPFPVTMVGDGGTANVVSFAAIDLDDDDDDDLVAVISDGGTRGLRQARNAYEAETDQVSFLAPEPLEEGDGALLVVSGDVDGNGQNDIVAIGTQSSAGVSGGKPMIILRPFENCAKLGDLNGDCVVDGGDLVLLIDAWGTCETGVLCPADLGGDGGVGFSDLTLLLGAWGGG